MTELDKDDKLLLGVESTKFDNFEVMVTDKAARFWLMLALMDRLSELVLTIFSMMVLRADKSSWLVFSKEACSVARKLVSVRMVSRH